MKPIRFSKVHSKKNIFRVEGFTNDTIWLRNIDNKDILKQVSYLTFRTHYKMGGKL